MLGRGRSRCWFRLADLGSGAGRCAKLSVATGDVLLPFAAGSVTDAVARLVAKNLQAALGQPFLVENRAGAGGTIAASAVARRRGDGYTLILTTNSTHSAASGLFKSVPYDPIKDFTPVVRIGGFPISSASIPASRSATAEFVAFAKANPGKLDYGVGNSTGHIVGRNHQTPHRNRNGAGRLSQQPDGGHRPGRRPNRRCSWTSPPACRRSGPQDRPIAMITRDPQSARPADAQ